MNLLTTPATRTAVSANGLRKTYGDKVVLDNVDLTIGEGEVFALLGPNGAGKTTTVQILSTLIPADAGKASAMGYDLREQAGAVRGLIGVTGQFSAVDDLLTGEENLLLMGRLLHVASVERRKRATELLERFDLVEAARQTPATYSGGMKRRLDIAMSLMGRPRLIFLDEPTTGLDPRSRHTMWQIIPGTGRSHRGRSTRSRPSTGWASASTRTRRSRCRCVCWAATAARATWASGSTRSHACCRAPNVWCSEGGAIPPTCEPRPRSPT